MCGAAPTDGGRNQGAEGALDIGYVWGEVDRVQAESSEHRPQIRPGSAPDQPPLDLPKASKQTQTGLPPPRPSGRSTARVSLGLPPSARVPLRLAPEYAHGSRPTTASQRQSCPGGRLPLRRSGSRQHCPTQAGPPWRSPPMLARRAIAPQGAWARTSAIAPRRAHHGVLRPCHPGGR